MDSSPLGKAVVPFHISNLFDLKEDQLQFNWHYVLCIN